MTPLAFWMILQIWILLGFFQWNCKEIILAVCNKITAIRKPHNPMPLGIDYFAGPFGAKHIYLDRIAIGVHISLTCYLTLCAQYVRQREAFAPCSFRRSIKMA